MEIIKEKIGIITGIKIVTKKDISEAGIVTLPYNEFKIETSDLDYDVIEKHFVNIYEHLNINKSKNVIKSAKFDFEIANINFEFRYKAKGEEEQDDLETYSFVKLKLTGIEVTYKEDVPTWSFIFLKQVNRDDYDIHNSRNVEILFTIGV